MKTPVNSFKKMLYAGKKQGLFWPGLSSLFSAKVVSDFTGKVN